MARVRTGFVKLVNKVLVSILIKHTHPVLKFTLFTCHRTASNSETFLLICFNQNAILILVIFVQLINMVFVSDFADV